MTENKYKKVSIVLIEGSEVQYAKDIETFIFLCEQERIAVIKLRVSKYEKLVQKLLEFFVNKFGLYSNFAKASTDIRLICPKCGHEFDNDQLTGLAGAGKFIPLFSSKPRCLECGNKDALYFYDNWKPVDVSESDISALRTYYKAMAVNYFQVSRANPSRCMLCGINIDISNSFLITDGHGRGKLECAKCIETFFGNTSKFLTDLREDPSCVCRSQLRNARNFVAGKYSHSLDLEL